MGSFTHHMQYDRQPKGPKGCRIRRAKIDFPMQSTTEWLACLHVSGRTSTQFIRPFWQSILFIWSLKPPPPSLHIAQLRNEIKKSKQKTNDQLTINWFFFKSRACLLPIEWITALRSTIVRELCFLARIWCGGGWTETTVKQHEKNGLSLGRAQDAQIN